MTFCRCLGLWVKVVNVSRISDFTLFDVFPRFGAKSPTALAKLRWRRAIWKTSTVKTTETVKGDLLRSSTCVTSLLAANFGGRITWIVRPQGCRERLRGIEDVYLKSPLS